MTTESIGLKDFVPLPAFNAAWKKKLMFTIFTKTIETLANYLELHKMKALYICIHKQNR